MHTSFLSSSLSLYSLLLLLLYSNTATHTSSVLFCSNLTVISVYIVSFMMMTSDGKIITVFGFIFTKMNTPVLLHLNTFFKHLNLYFVNNIYLKDKKNVLFGSCYFKAKLKAQCIFVLQNTRCHMPCLSPKKTSDCKLITSGVQSACCIFFVFAKV